MRERLRDRLVAVGEDGEWKWERVGGEERKCVW